MAGVHARRQKVARKANKALALKYGDAWVLGRRAEAFRRKAVRYAREHDITQRQAEAILREFGDESIQQLTSKSTVVKSPHQRSLECIFSDLPPNE